LHADLVDVPKAGVYRYLLFIFDVYTRYEFPRLLKTNDKATEEVLWMMRRAQVLHQNRIKYIHTHQVGEFSSTVIKIATAAMGIVITNTAIKAVLVAALHRRYESRLTCENQHCDQGNAGRRKGKENNLHL
jgi:hypothetical protein